jgi:hypothetical protein
MDRVSPAQRVIRYGNHIADRLVSPRKESRYPVRVRTTFVRLTRRGTGNAA